VGARRRVEVAVPLPVRRRFTYLWPEGAAPPLPGQRVVVPFGRRRLTGVIMRAEVKEPDPSLRLREVERILEAEPSLPPVVLDLVRFAADYYVVAEGEMLRAALPAGLSAAGREPASIPREDVVTLKAPPEMWEEREASLGRAPAQAAALCLLRKAAGRMLRQDLRRERVTAATLRALLARDWIEILHEPRQPHAPASLPELTGGAVKNLTGDQEIVTARLVTAVEQREGKTFLLQGVTGSGKTEVYLRAAAAALKAGRQVLILVPEIGLTPALASRLARRFGDLLAVLHSGLSGTQRRAHWDRARRGEARVVLGARSAVFAPLADVGLIVVDEEHDSSYKQDESPRYHGRDLALVRGRAEQCPVVLASATPSMESFQRAVQGKDTHLIMPRRVHARPMPRFEIVDLRREFREVGRANLVSRALESALMDIRHHGGQAMLLLNRRGWASFLLCRACGDPVSCPSCSVSLTLHKDRRRLACHYCGHEERVPPRCPCCDHEALQEMGAGTERLEDELATLVPGLRIMRMDADAVRRAGGHAAILSRFAKGEADVLLGTQMIAKGHDIPGVTLVGILGGDAALSFPDFRAAEWTFQLVSQAAGRAGRGREPGRVILQAFRADHYALLRARDYDYAGFYADEDRFRRALLYPPHAVLAAVRVRHRRFDAGEKLAMHLGDLLRADPDAGEHLRILGPAPAPLARLRGYYRFHLLLKSRRRRRLTAVLRRLADQLEKKGRQGGHVIIDVDPVSLM